MAAKDATAAANDLATASFTNGNAGDVNFTLKDGTKGTLSYNDFHTKYGVSTTETSGSFDASFNLAIGNGTDEAANTYTANNITVDNTDAALSGYKIGETVTVKPTVSSDGTITLSDKDVASPLEFNLHVGSESASNRFLLLSSP